MKGAFIAIFGFLGTFVSAEEEETSPITVVISVAEQKLAILNNGGLLRKYPISTSKFGLGDAFGSYKTPLGKMKVCQKIGDDLTAGAVLKQRHATGEILPVNAPGRDPIVTRILWLEGLEAHNQNARNRGIYIHGTVEESKIGEPVSYGCIRMRSKDVVEVFAEVPLDAPVTIITEKFPRFPKYTVPKPPIIAAAPPVKPTPTPAPPPVLTLAIKKTAPATPRPVIVVQAPPPPSLAPATKPPAPANPSKVNLAFQGSMLDAGLPQGPKIPVLPAEPEPKEVARFSPLTPEPSPNSAASMQGMAPDLSSSASPDDTAPAARTVRAKAESEAAPTATKSSPNPSIAFRRAAAAEKAKP